MARLRSATSGQSTFALYKPFGVLSQFRSEGNRPGLETLSLGLPKDVWPVGRLDADSEGLLLLTSDMTLRAHLTEPQFGHSRTYDVQVEGEVTEEHLAQLTEPMALRINKREVITKPAEARVVEEPGWLPERHPPIRFRKSIPTSWLQMVLREGKNRQVRRMTAAVGLPTLRLVRTAVGSLTLASLGLDVGESMQLSPDQIKATRKS